MGKRAYRNNRGDGSDADILDKLLREAPYPTVSAAKAPAPPDREEGTLPAPSPSPVVATPAVAAPMAAPKKIWFPLPPEIEKLKQFIKEIRCCETTFHGAAIPEQLKDISNRRKFCSILEDMAPRIYRECSDHSSEKRANIFVAQFQGQLRRIIKQGYPSSNGYESLLEGEAIHPEIIAFLRAIAQLPVTLSPPDAAYTDAYQSRHAAKRVRRQQQAGETPER